MGSYPVENSRGLEYVFTILQSLGSWERRKVIHQRRIRKLWGSLGQDKGVEYFCLHNAAMP